MKSVQIRSFLCSVFSCIQKSHILKQTCSFQLQVCLSMCDFWIQENADQKKLRIWTLFTQWFSEEIFHPFCSWIVQSSRMDQGKFVENSQKFVFFKGCLPKILLGSFLDTLSLIVLALILKRPNIWVWKGGILR